MSSYSILLMMNPVDFDVFADSRCVETKLLGADASFYKTSRSRIHHCCFKMRHIYSWLSSVIYICARMHSRDRPFYMTMQI